MSDPDPDAQDPSVTPVIPTDLIDSDDDTSTGGLGEGAGRGQGLLRSSAIVAAGTGLSRVTGLLRTMALAYALGTAVLADSYNLANTTPNIVYDLLIGGILAATLIPVFVESLDRGDDEAVDAVLTVATVLLTVLTLVAIAAAPLLIGLYAWRLSPEEYAQQVPTAVYLLRLFLPQILFYGLAALGTALLNARRRFGAAAFAPALNNVIVIAVLLAFSRLAGRDLSIDQIRGDTGLLLLLGLGTTAGIVAMAVVLWPAIVRSGRRPHWRFDWRHPAVKTVARLSGWTIGAVVANQLALFVTLALLYPIEGGVSAYTYAFIFFQLPFGLLAVSIMTTFMPEMASLAGRGDIAGYRDRFGQGLRLVLVVMVPAALGYLFLGRPIISVVLGYGKFGQASVELTATVLLWFAVALPGFAIFVFTMRGFYAFKDTRTPFFLYVLENGINIGLAFALVGRYGTAGVIAAYAVAYTVAALVALLALRRRCGGIGGRQLAASMGRMAVAAALMALALVPVVKLVGGSDGLRGAARVATGLVVGIVVYVGVLWALRSPELAWVTERLGRGRARPDPAAMP